MKYLELGASLYLPAIHPDLVQIGRGEKFPGLRSAIFCTEDAVSEEDVPFALDNLQKGLRVLASGDAVAKAPVLFVRPRTPQILQSVLRMEGVEVLRGFVLPKFTLSTMESWFRILSLHPQFVCMPILETEDVFDAVAMRQLRDELLASPQRDQVAVLRIGGLDLLNMMGIRRSCARTIYDTAMQNCIQSLSNIFLPANFLLSAPVFECMRHYDILREEVELDMLHGLYLKSLIHPEQISMMEKAYAVPKADFEVAQKLLHPAAPAVFRMDDRMCEKTTHAKWARCIVRLAELYGLK